MENAQKVQIIRISVIVLLILTIILSISGLFAVRSSASRLFSDMENLQTQVETSVQTARTESFEEIARSRSELLEMIRDGDADILRLQRKIMELEEETDHINARLNAADIEEVEETVGEPPEEAENEEQEGADAEIEEEGGEAKTPKPKRQLWKRIIQFWRWF